MTYTHRLEVQRRRLDDTQTRRLETLLGLGRQLQPVEAGELRALARMGSEAQQEQARAKLAAKPGKVNRRQAEQLAGALGESVAAAVDRALDDRGW
jgi:hypothetical protein